VVPRHEEPGMAALEHGSRHDHCLTEGFLRSLVSLLGRGPPPPITQPSSGALIGPGTSENTREVVALELINRRTATVYRMPGHRDQPGDEATRTPQLFTHDGRSRPRDSRCGPS